MRDKPENSSTTSQRLGLAGTVLAGICSSILMYWITDQGAAVTTDSIIYIEAAGSMLRGNGFYVNGKPMTHFPPGYPILFGLFTSLCQGDIFLAGRLLAAFFFGINIVLFTLALRACTKNSLAATGCAVLIFLSARPALRMHATVAAEPPFIMFFMAALLLLALHIARPRTILLISASALAGFAIVTRYTGLMLFPTIVFALYFLGDRPNKLKLKDIALFIGVSSLPFAAWIIRNLVRAPTTTNRKFGYHPIGIEKATSFFTELYNFVFHVPVPTEAKLLLIGAAAAILSIGIVTLYRRTYIRRNLTSVSLALQVLGFAFFGTYIILLFVTTSFLDAQTPVDQRLLFPAFLPLTAAVFGFIWALSQELGRPSIWKSFVVFVLLCVSLKGGNAVSHATYLHKNGQGYTSRAWKNSEVISYVTNLTEGRKIYSNGPDVIRFLTAKQVAWIPRKSHPAKNQTNSKYPEELARMLQECNDGSAVIVYFNTINRRGYLPAAAELESSGKLPVLFKTVEGVVYGTEAK